MPSTIFWLNWGSCMEMISKIVGGFALMLAPSIWPESHAECEVWRLETAFAQSVEQHDSKAFASFLHPGAVFNAVTDSPARGSEEVRKNWAGIIEGKNLILRWRPQHVNIGGDPNVAISHGPYTMENSNAKVNYMIGYFTSVWLRNAKTGVWKVLFDGDGHLPTRAENAEALIKHMAQAPASCPTK